MWVINHPVVCIAESLNHSLGDRDDDVRSVAASCLLPVAGHLVEQLPESLGDVLLVLWCCLCDMKDDLSSSVGVVMDLLGLCPTIHSFSFPDDLKIRQASHIRPSDYNAGK